MPAHLSIGQRVRIADSVTRTAWGVPCNWGGSQGRITSGGGRVAGHRLWRVLLDGMECAFGGNDFAECVLETIQPAPAPAQPDLFLTEAS